jgi:hypothetical protein
LTVSEQIDTRSAAARASGSAAAREREAQVGHFEPGHLKARRFSNQ